MTGNEKIQVVVDAIAKAFEELVAGNIVKVSSGELENKGLDLDEQKLVLNILVNDKKVINYKAVKSFKSEDVFEGQTWFEILEAAADNVDLPPQIAQQEIIDKMLQSLTYKIEVLDGFLAFAKHLDHGNTVTSLQRTSAQAKVTFDKDASQLTYRGQECDIPDMSLQYFVCKLAFKNRKVAANEDDILDKSPKSQDSQRAVYDAVLAVNNKAKTAFEIEKLLVFKAGKVRINKIYQ